MHATCFLFFPHHFELNGENLLGYGISNPNVTITLLGVFGQRFIDSFIGFLSDILTPSTIFYKNSSQL